MEELHKIGKIIKISDVEKFDSGSAKLVFRIDTGEEWNNLWDFELFKKAEHLKHLDNFIKYNKIGDEVDVEFKIKTYHYTGNGKDSVFTSLSCWKTEKIQGGAEPVNNTIPEKVLGDNDLPF